MNRLVWFLITFFWIAIDQYTKYLSVIELKEKSRYVDFLPILRWFYAENYGAAFSFLAGQTGWQRWFFLIIGVVAVVGLSYAIIKSTEISKWGLFGYASILGGAIGNVFDRAMLGYVRDMISVYYEPLNFYFAVFNVADIAISIGFCAVIIDWIVIAKQKRQVDQL